jgi:2-amino-4-hydroxy-6-hydroxymethyldihydropteridine diphosphokinase
MRRALLALGGNLGNVEMAFARAVEMLRLAGCRVLRQSNVFETKAVGGTAGSDFKNAALLLDTDLEPQPLLDQLAAIETMLGRTEQGTCGPRPIDLDLVLHGSCVLQTARLTVPHPSYHYRRFVLDPACQIAEDLVDPRWQMTVGALRERLMRRPLRLALCGGTSAARRALAATLGQLPDGVELVNQQVRRADEATFYLWMGSARPNLDEAGREIARPWGDSDDKAFRLLPAYARLVVTGQSWPPAVLVRNLVAAAKG